MKPQKSLTGLVMEGSRTLAGIGFIFFAGSCTTVSVIGPSETATLPSSSEITKTSEAASDSVPCPVASDLASEYLPRVSAPPAVANCQATYSVAFEYQPDEVPPLLSLFNPLVMVGFPTGSSSVVAKADLAISAIDDTSGPTTYTAQAQAKTTESLYSVADNSALREAVLLAVRDEIQRKLEQSPPN